MKILITGGKSATALKLLKAFPNYDVILGDYNEIPVFSSSKYNLVSLGDRNDDTIAHSLLNNCLDLGVDMILPLSSFEIEAVCKSMILFNEFNIEVLLPNIEKLDLFFNNAVSQQSADWIVFKNGEVIFATQQGSVITDIGKEEKLNGAYYIHSSTLSLITI